MLYFLAITWANVDFPLFGRPMIRIWRGYFFAKVITSYINGLSLSVGRVVYCERLF